MVQINFEMLISIIAALAFGVNIIVQLTKEYLPLPTKLWTLIVSAVLSEGCLFAFSRYKAVSFDILTVMAALSGSFIVAYVAMYGFDTLKELWSRFKGGANINENN